MTKIQINNTVRDMTAEEEAQRDKDVAAEIVTAEARVAAEAEKATNKTNGNQKLLDLGLTQAEVDALISNQA